MAHNSGSTRSNESLEQQKLRNHALVFAGGHISWRADLQGLILSCEGWESFTGQVENQAIGMGWIEMIHHSQQNVLRKSWAELFQTYDGFEKRMLVRRIDGQYRTMMIRGVPVAQRDNDVVAEWVGTATDITDYLEAQQTDRLQYIDLPAVIDNMEDAFLVYNTDGQVTYCNKSAKTLFPVLRSASLPAIFPCATSEAFNEQGNRIEYDDLPVSRILRDGTTIAATNSMNLSVKRLDNVILRLAHSGGPIYDEHGNIEGAFICISDITSQYGAERRVQDALYVLLLLAEKILADTSVKISEIGPTIAELLKRLTPGTIISIVGVYPDSGMMYPIATTTTPSRTHRWRTRIQNLNIHAFTDEILQSFYRGEPTTMNFMLPAKPEEGDDGIRRNLVIPLLSENVILGLILLEHHNLHHQFTPKEIELVQGVGRLLSMLLRRQFEPSALAASLAGKKSRDILSNQFENVLRSFSHDLRTPLTVAKASIQFSQQLLRKIDRSFTPEDDDAIQRSGKIHALLDEADDQISIEVRLIDVLMDASRLENHDLQLILGDVHIHELLENSINSLPKKCLGRIELQQHKKNGILHVDRRKTMQALEEIIVNALKFSPVETKIQIHIRETSGNVMISVQDHGPGISKEYHKSIWDRFYRVSTIHQQMDFGPSLGLGLYLANGLITMQSGQITLESSPGQGSTFTIILPVAK